MTVDDQSRWKEKDAGSDDGDVALRYDRWVSTLSAPLAEAICDLARVRDGQSILDVGCGSGIATRAAAARVGPTGTVIGISKPAA